MQTVSECPGATRLVFIGFLNFSCGDGWVDGGWVLKIKVMLTQLSTKLELKLKLRWAIMSEIITLLPVDWLTATAYNTTAYINFSPQQPRMVIRGACSGAWRSIMVLIL